MYDTTKLFLSFFFEILDFDLDAGSHFETGIGDKCDTISFSFHAVHVVFFV
jgi:hypothetical protein